MTLSEPSIFPDQTALLSGGAFLILTYLFASIPFGLLLVRWRREIDIRTIGSRNIGATNAFRAGGKLLGVGTLAADIGKGALPVWISTWTFPEDPAWRAVCAITAVFGHCFPLYLKFQGGKGVATTFGALFPLVPSSVTLALLVLCVVLAATRIMAVSTLTAVFLVPIFTLLFYPDASVFAGTSLALAMLILVRHRSNLARLWRGSEDKLFEDHGSGSAEPDHQTRGMEDIR